MSPVTSTNKKPDAKKLTYRERLRQERREAIRAAEIERKRSESTTFGKITKLIAVP